MVLTAIDLFAVREALRVKPLGWRQLVLIPAVVVSHAVIWHQLNGLVWWGIPWWLSLSRIGVYDSLYLAPLLAVLLLARVAGYRLRSA